MLVVCFGVNFQSSKVVSCIFNPFLFRSSFFSLAWWLLFFFIEYLYHSLRAHSSSCKYFSVQKKEVDVNRARTRLFLFVLCACLTR